MSALGNFLDDYARRHPEWDRAASQRKAQKFFGGILDAAALKPIDPRDCDADHPELAGVNMDIGQCSKCWMPVGVMRPYGESFGWHLDDCSLPMRHPGYCVPGGSGHVMPEGWKLRG